MYILSELYFIVPLIAFMIYPWEYVVIGTSLFYLLTTKK